MKLYLGYIIPIILTTFGQSVLGAEDVTIWQRFFSLTASLSLFSPNSQIHISSSENFVPNAMDLANLGISSSFNFSKNSSHATKKEHFCNILAMPNNFTDLERILSLVNSWDVLHGERSTTSQGSGQLFILWPEPTNASEILNYMKSVHPKITKKISINCEVFFVFIPNQQQQNHIFKIIEMYTFKSKVFLEAVDTSNEVLEKMARRRRNLRKAPIVAISVMDEESGRIVNMKRVGKGLQYISGFIVSIFRDLRDFLNSTEVIVEGYNYVSEGRNGTLTGIGKQIIEGDGDIAVALSFFLPYRAVQLSFLQPVCAERILIFFRQPSINSIRSIYLQPFSGNLWKGLCGTWFIVLISILIIPRVQKRPKDDWFIPEAGIWVIGTFCQRGWYLSPSTIPMRIVAISCFLSSLVTLCAYSASVISSLAVETYAINSVSDLVDNSFTLMSDNIAAYDDLLKKDFPPTTINGLFREVEDNREAIALSLKGGHGVIYPADGFYSHARTMVQRDQELCNTIFSVPLSKSRVYSGLFIRKGSPLKELFSYSLLMISERGLVRRYLTHMYEETNPKCPRTKIRYKELLGLKDLFMAFLVLAGGHVFSVLTLLIEICVSAYGSQQEKIFYDFVI